MTDIDALLARLHGLHPLKIDLSLGRVARLLARLGDPQNRLPPVIHVAGTNGKGSTCAFLKAMLEADGRRVHMFTSPHLVRFNERIVLAGPAGQAQPIADRELIDVLERTETANAGEPLTFFEITTAAAFLAFAEHPADALVLEVGLGGRLDATNVVAGPVMSVITPVSLDHQQFLGATLGAIAGEKAGILKAGRPAVIARQDEPALAAIRARAQAIKAPLFVAGEDFDAYEQNGRLVYQDEAGLLDLPLPALIGRHQIENAGTAIAVARRSAGMALGEAAIAAGLRAARWPARMQRLPSGPLAALIGDGSELWLDGGHNPAGGAALAQSLADLEERSEKPLIIIAGMMAQKDSGGFLAHFRGLARRVITVAIPGAHDKAFEAAALAELARAAGLEAEPASDIEDAIRRAVRATRGEPVRIVICGSLYLAGHVLALQQGVAPQMN